MLIYGKVLTYTPRATAIGFNKEKNILYLDSNMECLIFSITTKSACPMKLKPVFMNWLCYQVSKCFSTSVVWFNFHEFYFSFASMASVHHVHRACYFNKFLVEFCKISHLVMYITVAPYCVKKKKCSYSNRSQYLLSASKLLMPSKKIFSYLPHNNTPIHQRL